MPSTTRIRGVGDGRVSASRPCFCDGRAPRSFPTKLVTTSPANLRGIFRKALGHDDDKTFEHLPVKYIDDGKSSFDYFFLLDEEKDLLEEEEDDVTLDGGLLSLKRARPVVDSDEEDDSPRFECAADEPNHPLPPPSKKIRPSWTVPVRRRLSLLGMGD